MVNQLFQQLSRLSQVEAIALGGSRAGEHYDEKSDYDIYVYVTSPVPEETRRELLSQYCSVMEIGNHFWEYEDNCTLKNGIDIDLLWRDLTGFVTGVSAVVDGGQASNGYTTCMWHNLRTCKVLYDRDGRLTAAQNRYRCPYPEALRKNIIRRNRALLRGSLPAYETQIRKAAGRGDLVSVNHRVTEFLASYFDLLFALNRQTHPGEKRLVELCKAQCPLLPERFEENLNALFRDMFTQTERVGKDLDNLLTALDCILEEDARHAGNP